MRHTVGRLISETLPGLAASFERAHAAFQLGQVSRAGKVLVIAALFGTLEPVVNPCQKQGKHNNPQEVARK
jgi:hypothetical protein